MKEKKTARFTKLGVRRCKHQHAPVVLFLLLQLSWNPTPKYLIMHARTYKRDKEISRIRWTATMRLHTHSHTHLQPSMSRFRARNQMFMETRKRGRSSYGCPFPLQKARKHSAQNISGDTNNAAPLS